MTYRAELTGCVSTYPANTVHIRRPGASQLHVSEEFDAALQCLNKAVYLVLCVVQVWTGPC